MLLPCMCFRAAATGVTDVWVLALWNGFTISTSTLVALGNGIYQESLTPTLSGAYVAHVSTNGETLGQGPLAIRVWPGPIDVSLATTTGAGTSFGVQETELAFEVQMYDSFGNPQISGGALFAMVFSGAGLVKDMQDQTPDPTIVGQFVTDNLDGTYNVDYICPEAGLYSVGMRLSIAGELTHIANSPFEVFIDIQQNTDPASIRNSYAYEAGVDAAATHEAGVEQQFRIQAVDNREPPVLKGIGGDDFTVLVIGASTATEIEGVCTDYNIGIYYCSYTYSVSQSKALRSLLMLGCLWLACVG